LRSSASRTAHWAAASISAELSTPTMITLRRACSAFCPRSAVAMNMNFGVPSADGPVVAGKGVAGHDHWPSIVGTLVPGGQRSLIIGRLVSRMIMEPLS
jgi:hypothetical protein